MDEPDEPMACPFCGRAPRVRKWATGARVECSNSRCQVQPIQKMHPTKERAIITWNLRRRPTSSAG